MPTTQFPNENHSINSQHSPSPETVSTDNENPTSKVRHTTIDFEIGKKKPFKSTKTIKDLTSETMMRNSLLQELDRQNRKVTETRRNSDKPSTLVKRKRKLTTFSKKIVMKHVRSNMDEVKKTLLKKSDQVRKRNFRHNQDEFKRKQERECTKKEKVRKSDQARKKSLRDIQDEFEKEKVRKSDQARKKNLRDIQDEFEKEKFRESDQARKKN
ncbi:uncharacterized protein [Clytia hemisphaerica]|uniref:uncharacterized protein n=1 Tax=Clytia hemisphaerica TaxID=252671 RepID=UPI0034D53E25